ncbi:MAG TPA: hypothetical protein VFG71_00645 [Nitrospiraceae bacterium]|nr:hypothetical protein [Nitrospiraceae bacterium]
MIRIGNRFRRGVPGRCSWIVLLVLLCVITMTGSAEAAAEVEFAGTVLTADAKTGKLAVKKESGGTRFTFVTGEQTRWEDGLKGIADLKKDDHVVVVYQVQGSQYIALRVAPKK